MKIDRINQTKKVSKMVLFLYPAWKFHESLKMEKHKYQAN